MSGQAVQSGFTHKSPPSGSQERASTFHGRGDCPEYIDTIYDWAATCRRGCRYLCYFNLPDGGVELTLDQTPASLARLKTRAAGGAPRATP